MHKLPTGVRIPSLEALNDALDDGNHDYAILLNGGVFSRKTITRTNRGYSVLNSIDDTRQHFTPRTIMDESRTNIGKAMKVGALVVLN